MSDIQLRSSYCMIAWSMVREWTKDEYLEEPMDQYNIGDFNEHT